MRFSLLRLLIVIVVSVSAIYQPVNASDTDSEPFMVYIDPVTGKYTTQKPHINTNIGKDPETRENTPAKTGPETTELAPAFITGGGMLIFSYLLALVLSRTSRRS
jgi:hypothetical protein